MARAISEAAAPDGTHSLSHETIIPAPVEQVWDAIATAEGITSWMMPTELEARWRDALAARAADVHECGDLWTAVSTARHVARAGEVRGTRRTYTQASIKGA